MIFTETLTGRVSEPHLLGLVGAPIADTMRTFDVRNPANGALLATLPDMGVAETLRGDRCRIRRTICLG